MTLSHDQLVETGRRWLIKSRYQGKVLGYRPGCGLVLTEIATSISETPDVIGWYGRRSILLEAKASRADFKADSNKLFRSVSEMGIGMQRYYIAPKGMIAIDELPGGWGLIEVSGGPDSGGCKTRVVRESNVFSYKKENEIAILLSLIRRLDVHAGKHVSIRAYTIKTSKEPRATATFTREGS